MIAGVVIGALVLAIATARRPWVPLAVVVVIALALSTGSSRQLGMSVHPAVVLTFAVLAVQLVREPRAVLSDVARMLGVVVCFGAFILATALFSWSAGRTDSYGLVVTQVIAPAVLLFLVRRAVTSDARNGVVLLRVLVWACVAEAVLVLLVANGLVPQPNLALVSGARWFEDDPERAVGTLDHPLVAGVWLAAAIPAAAVIRTGWLRLAASAVLFAAVLLTGARTAVVIAAIALLLLVLRSTAAPLARIALVLVVLTVGALLVSGPLGATTLGRFADDGGSSTARGKALALALEVLPGSFLRGGGVSSSEHVTRDALLPSTFENPLIVSTIDFGGVFTLLFFGALVALVLAGRRTAAVPEARLAAVAAFLGVMGFNSFGAPSTVGFLVFVVVALAAPPSSGCRVSDVPQEHAVAPARTSAGLGGAR